MRERKEQETQEIDAVRNGLDKAIKLIIMNRAGRAKFCSVSGREPIDIVVGPLLPPPPQIGKVN